MGDETGPVARISREFNLFASERFVITTYLDDAEIHRRLEQAMESRRFWFLNYKHKPYTGKIFASGFQAERIFHSRGLAPLVVGSFWNDGEHTLIDMKIAQQPATLFGLGIRYIACIVLTVMPLFRPVDSSAPGSMPAMDILAVALLAWGIMAVITVMYTREIGRSKQFFRELLEDIGEG